jgi:hypothetical protein
LGILKDNKTIMKKTTILYIAIGLWSCNGLNKATEPKTDVVSILRQTTSLTSTEIKRLDSITIDFQFRGNCYAYSSIKNAKKSNGEAHSDNLPKETDLSFPKQGLYLVINQNEFLKIGPASLGCKLYLINTTDSLVTLNASDSRLYIVAEALNEKNEWTPISYLPSSTCGNSYHTVKLDEQEYWTFDIPIFKGAIKTKLRYTLSIDEKNKISSNEVVAYLSKGQFDKDKQEGYSNNDIMDPYEE